MKYRQIRLPKLNGLTPNLEGTLLKLAEELGELCREAGKHRGMSGEARSLSQDEVVANIAAELLDVAQTAVSMMYVLEECYHVNIDDALQKHMEKLIRKGYIKIDNNLENK
jgi:NTP pyrophosphatase (non-canonical NTP hydrolase)